MPASTSPPPRFHTPDLEASSPVGTPFELPEGEAHHALRVLRLREGDPVVVFNGLGQAWTARLTTTTKSKASGEITGTFTAPPEPASRLVLVFAVCKGGKPDLIIQKAVELGAHRVVGVMAERSQVKLNADRAEHRGEHWRQVAIDACKQCERAYLPAVVGPISFNEYLDHVGSNARLAFLEPRNPAMTFAAWLNTASQAGPLAEIHLLVGPEGGWTDDERTRAEEHGAQAVLFGPRILRAESACMAALAIAQSRLGDLR